MINPGKLWPFHLLLFAVLANAISHIDRGLDCREFTISVSVSARDGKPPESCTYDTRSNYTGIDDLIAPGTPGKSQGNYSLSARYCTPNVRNTFRSRTLQFLVHGSTYTKDYWSGLARPGSKPGQDQYSWLIYAANQGYSSLSIDRLCTGDSSHPNGMFDCQLPTHTETVHVVAQLARRGELPTVTTSFNRIIYVGHSFGSLIGNDLSVQYPSDIDAYVLTGFSLKLNQSGPAIAVFSVLAPASLVLPSRFGYLKTDLAYLISTSRRGVQQLFYYGNYDQNVARYDFDHRGVAAVAEAESIDQRGQSVAPDFKGVVFVLNGNQDVPMCSESPLQALANVAANCSDEFSSGVKLSYPGISKFGYYNTPNTGHCLNNHHTAQESFKAAHDFLDSAGF